MDFTRSLINSEGILIRVEDLSERLKKRSESLNSDSRLQY